MNWSVTGLLQEVPLVTWRQKTDISFQQLRVARPSAFHVLVIAFLALAGLSAEASELHLKQVAYLNRGLCWTTGRVVPFRCEPDSSPILVFKGKIPGTWHGVYFYQYVPVNRFRLAKVDTGNMGSGLVPGNMVPWAAGDVDRDVFKCDTFSF